MEKAVLNLLGPKFERYGKILSFAIDSTAREFQAEVELLGDPSPVRVSRARYRIETKEDQTILVLYDLKISREWAQNLIDDRFTEIPIKVPDFVGALL